MLPEFEPLLAEFREEAVTTRRVLERVPEDKLSWKPHAKSMSLGQLALHIAAVPRGLAKGLQQETVETRFSPNGPAQPASVQEILDTFETGIRDMEACIQNMSPDAAKGSWRLVAEGKPVINRSRASVLRSVVCNHIYHHRGQLSVYLRLLDVPVPVIYGRSADESLV